MLQLALLRSKTELDLAERKVAAAESELAVREADLAGMKSKLDEAVAFKTALKEDADATRMTMTKANQLITGLGGEREKWEKDVAKKQEQVAQLPGNILLGSAFLCYMGPFNQAMRAQLQKQWQNSLKGHRVGMTGALDIRRFLVPDTTVDVWTNIEGLPQVTRRLHGWCC